MVCQPEEGSQRKLSSLKKKPGKLVTADKKKVEVPSNLFAPIFNRNIQGQVGKNSEQTELAEDGPAYYRGLVPAERPFQPKFPHDSTLPGCRWIWGFYANSAL